jgi:hypothetical protein
MPTCIYCRAKLGTQHFNKEHVIPRQFGTFENNQTLIHTVCFDCNSYFSGNLERALGRDSFEAVFRLRHGQKPSCEFGGFAGSRLSFRIPAGMAGAGVVVRPMSTPDGKEIILLLPPQIGVRRDGETEFRYYSEEDLTREGANLLPTNKATKFRLLVAKDDDAGLERLRELIQAVVPRFREEGGLDLPPPEIVDGQIIVEVRGTIDKLIARAIAKIAFNYATKHAGAVFMLDPCFDPVRRFVRYNEGDENWRNFVQISTQPLLAEETKDLRVTRGHIVMLGWRTWDTLQVRVSPYNSFAYDVTMIERFPRVWRPLKIGHVFDWEHRTVHQLQAVSNAILPPGAAQRAATAYSSIVAKPRYPIL